VTGSSGEAGTVHRTHRPKLATRSDNECSRGTASGTAEQDRLEGRDAINHVNGR